MTFIDGAQARALAAKWRTLAYNGLRSSGTWTGNDIADRMEYMADELEALAAEQQQRQLDVVSPRTPEQIAATVAWVQSLADSDTAPPSTPAEDSARYKAELESAITAAGMDVCETADADGPFPLMLVWSNSQNTPVTPQSATVGADVTERIAVLTAHRACHSAEHDPENGRLHGYCIVCGVPFPCEYVGPAVVDEKYAELVYAVSRKYPGESRHETALRYIRQAESADHGPAQVATQHKEPKP